MKKLISIIFALILVIAMVSCQGPQSVPTETPPGTTDSNSAETEITTTATETTTSEEITTTVETTTKEDVTTSEEIERRVEGVWRAVQVELLESHSFYNVKDEDIMISIENDSLSLGSSEDIKQQYRRMGSIEQSQEDVNAYIVSMFSLASGRTLSATYKFRFYQDSSKVVYMEMELLDLKGDPTMFGFASYLGLPHKITFVESGFTKADQDHDPELFRSSDTTWIAMLNVKERIRFTYGDNFVVYINNTNVGVWSTTTIDGDKVVIISCYDGTTRQGRYNVGTNAMTVTWDGEDFPTNYMVEQLLYDY